MAQRTVQPQSQQRGIPKHERPTAPPPPQFHLKEWFKYCLRWIIWVLKFLVPLDEDGKPRVLLYLLAFALVNIPLYILIGCAYAAEKNWLSRSSAWWSQAISKSVLKNELAWVALTMLGVLTAIWNLKVWDSLGDWYIKRDYYMDPEADEEVPLPIQPVEMHDTDGNQNSAREDTESPLPPVPPPYSIFPDAPAPEQSFHASRIELDEPSWPAEAHTPQSSFRSSGSTPGRNISADPESTSNIQIPIPNNHQPAPLQPSQPLPNDTRQRRPPPLSLPGRLG